MSLGPVKPVTPSIAAQMSEAWVEPAEGDAEDNAKQDAHDQSDRKKRQSADPSRAQNKNKKTASAAHKILKKAAEAEAVKVNILDEHGKKVVPDVSGMVINILT